MSLRLALAKQHERDETMARKIGRYESSGLADSHRVALRLADSPMTFPGSISLQLREPAHEHFGGEEILELTLDVMKWNQRSVVLGVDDEVKRAD